MYSQRITHRQPKQRYTVGRPINGLNGGCGGRGMYGLADATYNPDNYFLRAPGTPSEQNDAIAAAQKALNGELREIGYWLQKPPGFDSDAAVISFNGRLYVVAIEYGMLPPASTMLIGPTEIPNWRQLRAFQKSAFEFAFIAILEPKPKQRQDKQDKQDKTDKDCPPPDDCQEKWIDKTLYVSSKPSKDAIEIPVAFKKLVCEGEATDDPQVDCDELLKALQESVQSGSVPGMMGLAAVPDNYPPDWCDDCEEKLVKASAYVTDSPAPGSKPFKVKVKVLVCETSAEPKINCEEVVKALGEGMRNRKRNRTIGGLRDWKFYEDPGSDEARKQSREAGSAPEPEKAEGNSMWWLYATAIVAGAYLATRK